MKYNTLTCMKYRYLKVSVFIMQDFNKLSSEGEVQYFYDKSGYVFRVERELLNILHFLKYSGVCVLLTFAVRCNA